MRRLISLEGIILPQHTGELASIEISGFTGQILEQGNQDGSVSKKSHGDNFLGCTRYNPPRLPSKGKSNQRASGQEESLPQR